MNGMKETVHKSGNVKKLTAEAFETLYFVLYFVIIFYFMFCNFCVRDDHSFSISEVNILGCDV